MEPRVGNKFRLGRKIGSGSFGEIYLGACRSCPEFRVPFCWVGILESLIGPVTWFCFFSILCAGTNIQTNEEVAIKLVRALFPRMDCLDLCQVPAL
jgi:serine/threonine protein kinase